jgi:hypothetical protein
VGHYPDSYWSAELAEGRWPDTTLTAAISDLLDQLEASRAFFHQIRSEGGKVEFVVGWFFDGLSGGTFDSGLLGRMSGLVIDLSLHVYPPDQHFIEGAS